MRPVAGRIRRSQVLYAGIGAVVDLPCLSVMLLGLGYWQRLACPLVVEPRLLAAVRKVLGGQVAELRESPAETETFREKFPTAEVGVPIEVFPRWLRCPLCDLLAPVQSGLFILRREPYQPDRLRYIHQGCPKRGARADRKMPGALPARFVLACNHGHLEDFPWIDYVHRGSACQRPKLRMFEPGVTGETTDIFVKCEECGAIRPMADAFDHSKETSKFTCNGFHPHLNAHGECGAPQARAMLAGATNAYFPILLSALTLPAGGGAGAIFDLVRERWQFLWNADNPGALGYLRGQGHLDEFAGCTDEALIAAIHAVRDSQSTGVAPESDLKRAEWNLLAAGQPLHDPLLRLRPARVPTGFESLLESVTLVDRFTEVQALVGFTRIESTGDVLEIDSLPPERRGPLSRTPPTWVPVSQFRGEGVFLKFSEEAVRAWEAGSDVRLRESELRCGHANWVERRPWMAHPPAFGGVRQYAIHTFSHAVMREFAIRCGYGSASVRERLYIAPASHPDGPMAGVLIETASADSEGTLGGLVSLGEPERLAPMLRGALERLRICSSDPMCSHVQPEFHANLHGAACHACCFSPESSCELSNRHLDRALLVPTMGTTGAALFP